MSEIVREKPLMEEVHKKYNNFIKSKLMMMEYEKKEAYLYGNQIMLAEERRLGKEEGMRVGKEKGIKEGIEKGIEKEKYSLAKNMKKENMNINLISRLTGLSLDEIEKL